MIKSNLVIVRSLVEGTVVERFQRSVDIRIDASNPVPWQKELFSTQDHAKPSYIRNVNGWARTVNLTCASPWNTAGRNLNAGTLVTPQHILTASHYTMPVGCTVRFIAMSGQVLERKLIADMTIRDTDICVGLLESELPPLIKPAMLLPPNAMNFIPNGSLMPVLTLDQEEKALISNVSNLNAGGWVSTMRPFVMPKRDAFYEDKISGDSGNPVLLVYGDDVIMITHLKFGGSGGGPSYIAYLPEILSTIKALGGNTNVTFFDFAAAVASLRTTLTLRPGILLSAESLKPESELQVMLKDSAVVQN